MCPAQRLGTFRVSWLVLPASRCALTRLSATSWGYREVLRDVSLEVSDAPDGREYALYAPYASIFHVRALDSHGHPQVDRKSRAEIGIIVIYLRETDKQRRERREEQPNFGSAIMYTPEDKRGVTAALVGLAKSLLVALDADFIPSWSWRVMWSWTRTPCRTLIWLDCR